MANFSNFYRNVRRNSRPQRKNTQATETLGNRIMRSSGVGASVNPLTPTQKAEQERAQRMRRGISPASYVVRSQVGRNITNAPRINKAVVTNNRLFGSLRGNALAPIKQNADYTRSQQSKYLNTDIQRKGMYTPATQLMAGKTNIGVEQGKTLRAGMMTNSPLIESWRPTSSAAEKVYRDRYGFNKEYQEALKRRLDNSSINEDVDARGTNRYDPHGDYAELSVPLPSGRAMPTAMTVQNGAGVYHVGDSIRDIKADDFRSGLADTFSSKNPEDVYRRQTGKELDEGTLQRLEQQRGTWGYNAGMMAGQMAQYGLTRGALSALGIVGKAAQAERAAKAAGNLNKARAISFGSELGIDQAASLPLNILDAFKENSPQEIWNRFKMNQGLDVLFSGVTTGISIANNPAFKEAKALHESANELRASGDKAMADATDMAAYKKIGEVPKEEIDLAQNEIRNGNNVTDNATNNTIEPKPTSNDDAYRFAENSAVEAGYPRETKTAPKKTTKNNTAETTEKQTAKPVKQTEQAQDKTWQEHAREDYKTGKQRAKAVEEGKIPSRENGEVVNAIKRLKETKDFSNVKDALNRGVKDGIYNRKIRHLDEEIDKAIKEIEADPEKAINDVLDYHPNGAKANDVPADAIPWVMKGYALCKWADANGMTALKEDIAATMAKAQSTGGSILRAGQVFTVMADTKTQRDIVAEYVEKMQEKYASRLGDHKLTVSEDLLNKLDNATTDAEKSKILDDITVHVWNQVPQSFIEAMGSFRIVSMLANTTTMIRNLASNAGFLGVREVDKSVNTMMEATAEKLNKIDRAHRTHTIYNPFSKENRKIQAYWYSDYGKHRNIIKGQSRWDEGGGTLSLDLRPQEGRHFGIKAGGGRKGGLIGVASAGLEGTRKATSWIMDTGDEAFLAPAYADAATQLMVVRGWKVEDLTPARVQEIRDYATLVAQQATYRDPSEFATALAKWGHWQKGDGALRLVRAVGVSGLQPFKKTPINVGKRAVEYSPIGFVKGVYDIRSAIKAGDSTAVNKAITELSKGTTGTGLVVAGYLLAEQGVINAQLPTDDEGYLRRDLGEQDYALNIGGKSRSLQWAAPGAIPILSGATLYDQVQQRGWNALLKPQTLVSVLSKSANPLLEMSFMQSYMDIAESTDDVKSVDKFFVGMEQIGLSYAAQYVPTMLGKIANLVDPVRRDTSSQSTDPYVKAYERFINKSVINKIPFKSKSLPAYRDAFGNIQTTEDVKDRIIQNFVSPWYTKEIKSDDPVFKELFRINNATPDTNLIPTNSIGKGKHELSLNGEKINLDPHDMEEYKRIRGEGNQKALEFIDSDEYKSMSDTEKAKALEDIYENAKVDAKRQMLLKKGKSEWDVYTEGFEGAKADQIGAAKNAGIDPKDYNHTLTDKTADADGNGTVSKSEYYDYLLKQNQYNDKQRAVLMAAKNKSWDGKYNPFVTGEPPKDSQAARAESTSYTDDIKSTGLSEKQFKEITSADTARIDSNGSGRVSQKEYQAYLDSFSYLTDEQKSALWKKYNPHWKKNPYDGSTASSGRSKRGRSGRRSSGGSSSKTKKREKTASEKRFAALQTGKAPTNAKGIEALSNGAKGLTKAQKKALVKLMQKKLDV